MLLVYFSLISIVLIGFGIIMNKIYKNHGNVHDPQENEKNVKSSETIY